MDRGRHARRPGRAGRAADRRAVRGPRRGGRPIAPAWRLIDSGPGAGPWNLALDEAIFRAVARRRSPPTLRLYRWAEPTLSIGYAQRIERDVDAAACAARGVGVLRRISGGRAVLHDGELTYSVCAPAELPGFGPGLDDACRAVAAGLVAGLRRLGVDGAGSARGARPAPPGPAAPRHPGCFASAARHEIEVGGRKLVGSAQRRSGDAFLQHGSILLRGHAPLLGVLLHGGARDAADRMVGLAELLDPCPSPEEVAAAVAAGCAAAWGVVLAPGAPTAAERRHADALQKSRYGSAAWNAGRLGLAAAR